MKSSKTLAALALWTAIVWAAPMPDAAAGEMTGSGTVTYVVTPLSSTKLGNGNTVVRLYLKGVVLAGDTGNPLHLASQDCTGSSLIGKTGKQLRAGGSCTGIAKDGDIW